MTTQRLHDLLEELVTGVTPVDGVDAAWERAVQLAAEDLELHFARDEASGRPIVELRTLSGELVKRISAAQALQIIAGRAPGAITAL